MNESVNGVDIKAAAEADFQIQPLAEPDFNIRQLTEVDFERYFEQLLALKYQSIRASFGADAAEEQLRATCVLKLNEAREYLHAGRAFFWGAFAAGSASGVAGEDERGAGASEDERDDGASQDERGDGGATSEREARQLDSGQLIGFLWAYPGAYFNEKRMFVNGLAVRGEYQRRGVARALLAALQSYCAAQGIATIYLQVAPENIAAVEFYRSGGFEVERLQMALHLERAADGSEIAGKE